MGFQFEQHRLGLWDLSWDLKKNNFLGNGIRTPPSRSPYEFDRNCYNVHMWVYTVINLFAILRVFLVGVAFWSEVFGCFFELSLSAYEVKNNCSLFERLFKVKKSGVFLFGISFFVLEIFAFLYYANEESDDVIDRSTKTIKYWIKNISRNIGAVIFKLGTGTVHHKRNKMTPAVLLPWQHPWFQSLSV